MAVVLLVGCADQTRIRVTIDRTAAGAIDTFQIKVEDRFGVAQRVPSGL